MSLMVVNVGFPVTEAGIWILTPVGSSPCPQGHHNGSRPHHLQSGSLHSPDYFPGFSFSVLDRDSMFQVPDQVQSPVVQAILVHLPFSPVPVVHCSHLSLGSNPQNLACSSAYQQCPLPYKRHSFYQAVRTPVSPLWTCLCFVYTQSLL